ncbi:MAG: hypothetical protein Ct9H90mP25_5840 [Gammaproteobacteria bacterium]|nr:MAG: hypothetical protein Ct9H90mP25_5840 [Gammaproteobacteria bacterium]
MFTYWKSLVKDVHREGICTYLMSQVNPGDTSFQHIHDQAILLPTIQRVEAPPTARLDPSLSMRMNRLSTMFLTTVPDY